MQLTEHAAVIEAFNQFPICRCSGCRDRYTAIIAAAVEKVLEPYSVLHDAVSKYMQHKNNTQANHCGDRTMDIRMIYRQDGLNALDALNPKEPTP